MKLNNLLSIIDNYKKNLCQKLLYTSPQTIIETRNFLYQSIKDFLKENSPVYKSHDGIITKETLNFNRDNWYFKKIPHIKAKTSGSTTGISFEYLIDRNYYNFIELKCHYRACLQDFNLSKATRAGNFYLSKENNFFRQSYTRHQNVASHGLAKCNVFSFISNQRTIESTIEDTLSIMMDSNLDVLSIDGTGINFLANYFKRTGFKNKICKILSNTNEKIPLNDADWLRSNGNIDDYIDHMRSWDGGASFLTCKHHTYHLLDNLSNVQCVDGKLISTDFFSFASPFLDYWNGDFCEINDNYKLCECGRWFRPFKFTNPRNFTMNGLDANTIQERIKNLKISGIAYMNWDFRCITVYMSQNISQDNQLKIKMALPEFSLFFHSVFDYEHMSQNDQSI